jgi:hypothetical protein
MRYLVFGSDGPGFSSADEMIEVLENEILPTFDVLERLEAEGRIVAGGLPVGERTFAFIAEAESHEELDSMLRRIPSWGELTWEVTPLQTFAGRARQERTILEELKEDF